MHECFFESPESDDSRLWRDVSEAKLIEGSLQL
jgi:hypothetical protein